MLNVKPSHTPLTIKAVGKGLSLQVIPIPTLTPKQDTERQEFESALAELVVGGPALVIEPSHPLYQFYTTHRSRKASSVIYSFARKNNRKFITRTLPDNTFAVWAA